MTEIPEHLLRRAGRAKAREPEGRPRRRARGRARRRAAPAAAERPADVGRASRGRVAQDPRPPRSSAAEQGRARQAAARRRGGGGGDRGDGRRRRRRRRRRRPRSRPRPAPPGRRPGPAVTPSACSRSSSPARSRTSRPAPTDKVHVWPHLLVVEFVAALAMTAFLLVFSIFVNAPLLATANINLTPNPSKAPWYFLGLQELLTMFHPMVAGVTIPGMGLFGLMLAPLHRPQPEQQARGPQVRDRRCSPSS